MAFPLQVLTPLFICHYTLHEVTSTIRSRLAHSESVMMLSIIVKKYIKSLFFTNLSQNFITLLICNHLMYDTALMSCHLVCNILSIIWRMLLLLIRHLIQLSHPIWLIQLKLGQIVLLYLWIFINTNYMWPLCRRFV